jgi:hypothetical protein
MKHRLNTLGHATLLLSEDDQPLIATDPWLVGSTYWRSWWLEKYPTEEEFERVKQAKYLYITHSHPDHFHYPTLRKLGKPATLHPSFPRYEITGFLESAGFPVKVLEPWRWYNLSDEVKIASIPTPIDDSIMILETPTAYIANLNDSVPRLNLLKFIRNEMFAAGKPVIMLKSYSPASIAVSIYREGVQTQMKNKKDYTETAVRLAEALGADYFVPFASQAFFNRKDSKWANDFKVTYEDLKRYWNHKTIKLCEPFVDIDLESFAVSSDYSSVNRSLDEAKLQKVAERESEEENFVLPADFTAKLEKYMSEIYFLRTLFRRGIGWKLVTSGKEFFYNTKTGKVEDKIPEDFDVAISLPDKVLYESLENNVLTDLGITMFIKVETRRSDKFTYGLFLLMGLHDYGHFNSYRDFIRFARFYAPYFVPPLLKLKWLWSSRPSSQPVKSV